MRLFLVASVAIAALAVSTLDGPAVAHASGRAKMHRTHALQRGLSAKERMR